MAKTHLFNLPDGFCRISDPKYQLLKRCEWKGKIRQHGHPRKHRVKS